MRCSKCKNELSETDKYCSCCGKSVNKNDSIWMLILGFLFPYPSIIAYICLRYSKSSIGSNLIKGAIVQIIIQFVLSAIIFVFAFSPRTKKAISIESPICSFFVNFASLLI